MDTVYYLHSSEELEMKKIYSGKVRDVYEVVSEDREGKTDLVIVTTDRISAFDVVLSKEVAGKGKVLNKISNFWFDYTKNIVNNHIISTNSPDIPNGDKFDGRAVLVRQLQMLPFEFIVRGYIFGNMWDAYTKKQPFCGQMIRGDYQLAQKLDKPIITPSTKANEGHDVYVSISDVAGNIGQLITDLICEVSLELYKKCYDHAYEKGIIIADTKFEFGIDPGGRCRLTLADEVFTPDSSRFWNLADYRVGESPKSYDKQFVRDWLTNNKVDGQMQFDNVPDEIIQKTSEIYAECLQRITGESL
jgi:phosphoribosylaminoimidazole-succinocarboxamide synthase